jgi:hypothetical protein
VQQSLIMPATRFGELAEPVGQGLAARPISGFRELLTEKRSVLFVLPESRKQPTHSLCRWQGIGVCHC